MEWYADLTLSNKTADTGQQKASKINVYATTLICLFQGFDGGVSVHIIILEV